MGTIFERKEEWIGGELQELTDSFPVLSDDAPITKIVDITLKPNGEKDAFFQVEGESYGCGFCTAIGGVMGVKSDEGWLTLAGYAGHTWRIRKRKAITGAQNGEADG